MNVPEVAGLIEDRMRSRHLTLEQAAESMRAIIKNDELVDAATSQIKKTIGEIEDLRDPDTVSKRRFVPWYTGPGQSDFFWPRLKKYLVEEKGWDEATVESIDQSSTKVISQLPCPALAEFDGRGLVLGYVQSGKTANFTAVVSKAADVGFRLIVILSGLTNSLRRQTQERMEADLIERAPARWVQWTNAAMDIGDLPFSAEAMLSQSQSRNLAVVKKNPHRLRRLLGMLRNTSPVVLRSAPILIIDDECDQASVNSARLAQDRTTINRLLVELLALVPKAAYVGYTATPYANVLVDPTLPEDLYPRDFVINLPRPEGYFGAERLFGRRQIESDVDDRDIDDGLDMIRCIPANQEAQLRPARAQKDDWAMPITPAVADAIRYFLLASAARRVRNQVEQPSAMLIHTTHYAQPHNNSRKPVREFLSELSTRLGAGDPALLEELSIQWSDEHTAVDPAQFRLEPVLFDDLLNELAPTIEATKVFVENGLSDERLEGYQGPSIVIGGNILARGLTIDGLVCSLFVRTASLYDSLMQMGRWFGYRRGYEDLPRVWMTEELESYFRDLATVEHEIRQDIARYSDDGTITPEDLGVRIRLHPRLEVTSTLKQRAGKIVGQRPFDGKVLQTIRFNSHDAPWLAGNLAAGAALVHAAAGATDVEEKTNGYVYRGVPWKAVEDFLKAYRIHETHLDFRSEEVRGYVAQQQQEYDELQTWNVAVIRSTARGASRRAEFGPLRDIPMVVRTAKETLPNGGANIGALLTRGHATLDFPAAFTGPTSSWDDLKNARGPFSVRRSRAVESPLMLLYLVDRDSAPASARTKTRHPLEAVDDVLGLGIVFPETDQPVSAQYIVAAVGQDAAPDAEEIDDAELGLEDDDEV